MGQQLYLDLLQVFLLCGLLGVPLIWLTPPPSAEFTVLCLQRDAYRAAAHLPPLGPTPTRLFHVPSSGLVPAGAHAGTAALPYHQVGQVHSPPRTYGLRVPLGEGGEVWAEARQTLGYYQMNSSWMSTVRWYFGLSLFYLLLLGSSLRRLRTIRSRLLSVASAARRLAAGDRTASCPAQAHDPREIACLVTRLNEMGDALRERHRRLSQTRQQLERASAERNRRLAEVSHDLRTPLTSLLGYAQLYQDQGLGCLERVEVEGAALLQRVARWLDACRLESGVLELRLGEVHLHDVLEEAFDRAQQQHPLQAQVDLPDKSPVIVADSFLLPRILARLLVHLNRTQIQLSLRWPQLVMTGSGPDLGPLDPAQMSLETCRQLLLQQRIQLQMEANQIALIWESPCIA